MTGPSPNRQEWIRVLLLVAGALALTYPFLSPLQIGGTDARWYAYMMADVLEQMRAGFFPALTGQGPFAWNGGIHPFRSAPLFMWVGGIWNALTAGRLSPLLVQHLTVVTSAVAGTVGFYRAAVALMPARRWEAWWGAVIYATAPTWIGVVVCADAYMSYMAFGVLPLVLYGNARSAADQGRRGYLALAAGLVLLWMAHPPIAALCTYLTWLIQTEALLTARPLPWRHMAGGVLWFAALGAGYFYGIAEIPPLSGPGPLGAVHDLAQLAGLTIALFSIGRYALVGSGRRWLLAAVAGCAVLAATSVPWLVWALLTSALALAVSALGRRLRLFDGSRQASEILFACAVTGAALANPIVVGGRWARNEGPLVDLADNTSHAWAYLRPEHWPLRGFGVDQIGWSISIGLLAVGATFFGRRPWAAKGFFTAAAALLLCFVRVPGISDSLVGYFPPYLLGLGSIPLRLRLLPVIAGFGAMGGCLWAGIGANPGKGRRRAVGAILALAAGWSAFQASYFVRWAMHQTGDPQHSADSFRSENVVLDRFAYDLLPLPAYYSNGEMDPLLENRLLDANGAAVAGPQEAAAQMETAGKVRIRLMAHTASDAPGWLRITPGLTILPGEHLLVRFEFDPQQDYTGFLIEKSEHDYREYHLPDSGMGGDVAFGVGPLRGKVLSMWNTGTESEHFAFTLAREPGNSFSRPEAWFADLVVSHFVPALQPVRMDSWIPYRATVSAPGAGRLETVRAYLPGYRATVDGRPVPVESSPRHLAQVAVPAGVHRVELRFVGTLRWHIAVAVSLVAWAMLGWVGVARWRPRRGGARWAGATALTLLFAAELYFFHHYIVRNETWIYPRWNDQIQYLTEAYTGYEFTLWHGLIPGLWQTLLKPSAQGVLYDTFATIGFWFLGPARGVALAVNLIAWIGLQAAFYAVATRRLGSRGLAWVAVGLLLAWRTPVSGWAGSAVDFRLDFMAACAFGMALAATIDTDGFRSSGRSVLAGLAIGLCLCVRFLTGTYFVVILLGLFAWVAAGPARWRRVRNLLLTAGIAAAMALPEFWRNREWVWNYYVIGHFTGPESAIRNPHLGVGASLRFVAGTLVRDHLGEGMGWLVLGVTVTLTVACFLDRHTRAAAASPRRLGQAGWWVPAVLFTCAPFLILTLHNQKSPIVLSILAPGVIALLLGGWSAIARRLSQVWGDRAVGRGLAAVGAAAVLAGGWLFLRTERADPPAGEFYRDAQTVNRLADLIYASSARAGLVSPRIGVDRITDSLDGQVLRVIGYERHRVWMPFVMMLPTGIARERQSVILEHLALCDFVFLAEGDDGGGGFPYDQEMRELHPETEAWCRLHLHPVERFSLYGHAWVLYARAGLADQAAGR